MAATQAQARAALVRVDQLEFHPKNVRMDLGDLRELAASIRELGVLEPLIVEDRPGRGRVLAGHRRLAAARQAGAAKVPCVLVEPKSDDDAIATMFSENRHRLPMTQEEKMAAVRSLHGNFGWTQTRIAKCLGVSPQTVAKWLAGRDDDSSAASAPAPRPPTQSGARHRTSPTRRTTVATAKVRTVLARWDGAAPSELLDELRDLLGDEASR